MLKNQHLRTVICKVVVDWLLVTEIMSQSYKGSYDGYVFTLPGVRVYRTNHEAQTLCAQNGSNLLEIKSSYVQNLTVQFLRDIGVQFAEGTLLITNGIRSDFNGWIWVNGQDINSVTVTGQGQDFANSFGYINFSPSSMYITAGMPTDTRGYICQVAGTFECADVFSQNERCFKSYSSPTMSWFDARNQCLNEGGDLASFDFINDNQGLNSTLNRTWLNSSSTYWVGIRRQWWTWEISNLEANYTNWLIGRPVYPQGGGNRCICLYKNGTDWKWIECDCNSRLPFVCLTEPPTTPSTSTSTTPATTTISTERASSSLGLGNATVIYSKASSMEPPLPSTDSSVLAVGLGIGIPAVLVILALTVVIALMKKKLSYQTRLLANIGGDVGAVAHAQMPVRKNHEITVNEALEMVSQQNTSPYESLQREANAINDRHYQELQISGRRDANGPGTSDYEPVRSN